MKTLMLALLLGITANCGGNYCKDATHVNDMRCVISSSFIDCGTGAMINIVKAFEPAIFALVQQLTGSDGTVNWAVLGAALKSIGVSDAACILAKIETALESKMALMSTSVVVKTTVSSFSDGFETFRSTQFPAGTRIKMPGGSFR